MKRPLFNAKQRVILQLLSKSRAGFVAHEISQQTGIAWITVKKYLDIFKKKGIVIAIDEPEKDPHSKKRYRLNFSLIYGGENA